MPWCAFVTNSYHDYDYIQHIGTVVYVLSWLLLQYVVTILGSRMHEVMVVHVGGASNPDGYT